MGGLTGLTWLNVYSNSLGGSLPSSLGQLTRLQTLYLFADKFTAAVPASFCSLPRSMTHLQIQANPGLTCIPSCLTTANYPGLKDASLTAVCPPAALPVSYYPISSYPSGYTLFANNLVGYVSLPAQYTITFDVNPSAVSGTLTWRDIVRLTVPGAGDQGTGARLPVLHFCATGSCPALGIEQTVFNGGGSTAAYTSSGLPADAWSTVSVLMDSVNRIMTLQVVSAGTGSLVVPVIQTTIPTPSQQTWPSVQVYASDSIYSTASAKIRNLAIVPPAALPVSYYPSSSFPSGFILSAGNLVGVVALPAQYTVSFDLFHNSRVSSLSGPTWPRSHLSVHDASASAAAASCWGHQVACASDAHQIHDQHEIFHSARHLRAGGRRGGQARHRRPTPTQLHNRSSATVAIAEQP